MSENEAEILLVEDNANDAELTLRALEKIDRANTVVHVRDGSEALDYIFGENPGPEDDIQNRPKVILLDIKLPRFDGVEVLARLKGDIRTKTIPVVMMTSSREEKDLVRCCELGANSYIVKPVDFETFTKAVSDMGCYWLLLNQTFARPFQQSA